MAKLLKWFDDRIFFIGVVVLLIFIPLYPKFPLFNVPNTYVAIRFEDFIVALLVGIFLIKAIRERTNIFKDRLNRLFFAYFLVGGLSTLSAITITKNVFPNLVFLHWFRHIEYMSLFFIAACSVKKVQDVKDYISVIFLTTLGVVIYGLGQKFLGFPVISTMNEEFSKGTLLSLTEWARISSTFAGHYDLAAYLVLILAITVGSILGFRHFSHKIIGIAVGVMAFYLLILTASQISFMAYLASVTVVLLLSRNFKWIIPVLAISILGTFASQDLTKRYATTIRINRDLLLEAYGRSKIDKLVYLESPTPTPTPTPAPVISAPPAAGGTPRRIIKPIPTLLPSPVPTIGPKRYVSYDSTSSADIAEITAYRSITIRFNVEWPRSINAFLKNPILGTGYSSITLATDNDYLRILGETGLLGFLSIFLLFLEVFRRAFTYLSKKEPGFEKVVVIGIMGSIIGLLINASFIDVFEASKVAYVFWMLVGIMIGMINLFNSKRIT